ncbi:RNA polymerase II subunit 3 [Glugoides intestinalis]
MELKVKEITMSNMKFTVNSNVSFANSLRRILLAEVPSVAIDVVEIRENKTVLPDEMIANRLGLVPIRHTSQLVEKINCSCDSFCSECSIRFTLKKINETDIVIPITGQDLYTTVPGVQCHNSLLLRLAPGQMIDITCMATIGTPQTHAKYCPVTAVGFNYDPENRTRATELWAENDVKTEWPGIKQSDEVDWSDVDKVEFDFEVLEGVGKPKEILLKALEIYKEKMEQALDSVQ